MALLIMLLIVVTTPAQDIPPPAPTHIPPTPLPLTGSAVSDALLSVSALERIRAEGQVRVGIRFNEPPFGELNIRGEVVGYDAAVARSIAEAWGIDVEFVQVTSQNALDALLSDQVDLLIASQVHRRNLDVAVEFSHTYYLGSQAAMVRLDDSAQALSDMNNRRIGIVLGRESERAVAFWQSRENVMVSVQPYLTIDQALVALVNNEIDGIVDKRYRLNRIVLPDRVRVLDDVVQPEPYAIALRQQDVNLRNQVNRTLQFLAVSGRLAEIHSEYFPSRYPQDLIPLWDNIGESVPSLDALPTDVPYPQDYTIPRIEQSGVVRIAGLVQPTPDMPESQRRIAEVNLRMAEAIAARWGVRLEGVITDDPIGAVERGEADLALGIRPDWNNVNRVDYTAAYLLRGKRMMTTVRDDFTSLSDLRGKWVGVFADEPNAGDDVTELAAGVNATVNVFTILREQDAAFEMLEENNVDVVFADSVRLLPHVEANPEVLKFSERCAACDPWYTREYYGGAVPRNDIEFQLLVEYTLQELWLDGTLRNILAPVSIRGSELNLVVWPGSSDYMGFSLGS